MGSENNTSALQSLRNVTVRGLSALKMLLERTDARLEEMAKENVLLRERLVKLESAVEYLGKDVTGKHNLEVILHKEVGRAEAVKEIRAGQVEDKKIQAEVWKANAPIIVAMVTAASALVTTLLNLFLR